MWEKMLLHYNAFPLHYFHFNFIIHHDNIDWKTPQSERSLTEFNYPLLHFLSWLLQLDAPLLRLTPPLTACSWPSGKEHPLWDRTVSLAFHEGLEWTRSRGERRISGQVPVLELLPGGPLDSSLWFVATLLFPLLWLSQHLLFHVSGPGTSGVDCPHRPSGLHDHQWEERWESRSMQGGLGRYNVTRTAGFPHSRAWRVWIRDFDEPRSPKKALDGKKCMLRKKLLRG